ncbi:putative C2H2 finger domain protein (Ezf) [Aspergillus mulundensis]|uniref:C2H2-type domain-containing protein n=1 Tax=Aspergillus mulundensis TaxID=1810919 RepID=A0A3D8R8X6_9EURO|nr:hypothetical protein DSM5745_07986 [Aspergillus mulundensis]RDW70475.1 hypothetical protein DSM5745_07986 [Aspergillus mulundensis]
MSYEYSLDATQMTPATLCERYSGSDASASPLSYCGPQAMSATSSHGSVLDFGTGPDNMNTQMYNFLPNTPRSDPDIMIKEEPDADYPDAQCLEYTKPAQLPLFAPVAQHRTNRFRPKFNFFDEGDASEPIVADHDLETNLSPGPSAFQLGELPPWSRDNASADHEQLKVPSASGRQCTICGAQFTRRSNCREHEKRHDPSNRKSFACGVCGKALGRKTDLKRHVDSVHRGIRKYGCDECGARFTRQDTLARHISDGCRRTDRGSSDSRAAERHSSVDNQTTIQSR